MIAVRAYRQAPEYGPLPPGVSAPLPSTVLWRWRYELLALTGFVAAGWLAADLLGAGSALALGLAVTAGAAVCAPLRRAVIRRVLGVVTPHRIRVGLANAWVHNRRGRLPWILRTKVTDTGEAVLLWCPAGVSEEHITAAADVLCSACWARAVRVSADPRRRQLVTVHVIRR